MPFSASPTCALPCEAQPPQAVGTPLSARSLAGSFVHAARFRPCPPLKPRPLNFRKIYLPTARQRFVCLRFWNYFTAPP